MADEVQYDKTDLKLAFETLTAKQTHHNIRWDYYEGDVELTWSSDKLERVFNTSTAPKWVQDWCAVIVDSVLDRLDLKRLTVANDDGLTDAIDDLFRDSGLDIDASDVHKDAVLTGEGYVIAWKDEGGEVEAYHNDSRQCHLFKDSEHPRKSKMAAKWWDEEGTDFRHLTLYYPDKLEYWIRRKKSEDCDDDWHEGEWAPEREPATNPYGEIPVFQFDVDKRGASELDKVMPLQDIVNKTVSDMMIAAEFQSVPQRWAILQSDYNIDATEGTPQQLPYSPFGTVTFPAGDGEAQPTSTGTYPAADIRMFLDVMEKCARAMAIITRTPKHYLMAQAGDPSGEALMAMEAPLTRKVQKYQKRLQQTWRRVALFLLKLNGENTTVPVKDVLPLWQDVRTVQPLTEAQTRLTNVQAGIPIHNQLRDDGWTDPELDQLDEDARRAAPNAMQTTQGTPEEQAALAGVRAEQATADTAAMAENVVGMAFDIMLDAANKSGVIDKAIARKKGAET
jgi:hypothetical protein